MTDENWEEQFKQFLRKTGDDFRRASDEIKAEAQKLLDAAMDPARHQRVRDRLNELTQWARKTAEGMAGSVQDTASKAGTMFQRATETVPQEAGAASAAPARKPAAKKKSGAKPRTAKSSQKKGAKRKR
jgi:thioesterase domain-containing protein